MIDLIKKVLKYKNIYKKTKNYNNELFEKIILSLTPLITTILRRIKTNNIEDIYQEMIIKINEIIIKFKIEKYNYNQKYLLKFIKQKQNKKITYYEYNLFCNQNQFLKYIKISLINYTIDIVRKHEKEKREIVLKDILTLDNQFIESNKKVNTLKKLTNSQKEFVFLFLSEENNILTEEQVAKKLGISQQAVNKRKAKIKKFLKNF